MNDDVFKQYSRYYDLLYRDKDYKAEADYIARTLRSVAPESLALLELGSGTGRHGQLLAERGFDVLGIERSDSMVAQARSASRASLSGGGGSFNCELGDIRMIKLDQLFDAVISFFHVVSYQTRNLDLIATFANAGRHLHAGGIFFFDVWHGPAVLRERPSVRIKRMEDDSTTLTRIAEPELDVSAGVVTVSYTMFAQSKLDGSLTTFSESHRMRYLFASEIEFLARQTGFEVLRSEEFLTGKPPTENSWGVAYLLRKQG